MLMYYGEFDVLVYGVTEEGEVLPKHVGVNEELYFYVC